MQIKKIYIAEDGTEFSNEQKCRAYENELRENEYQRLEDYILFYNIIGNPIPYHKVRDTLIYYAKVLRFPDWQDTPERAAWEELVPNELDDRVESCGTGWYISDGDDNWDSWENYSADFQKHNEIISKIDCNGK